MSPRVNHVSVHARDLREATDFYVELLGAEPIATPNFGNPVQWLALGDTQLHLFERAATATSHHHFAVTVEDLAGPYEVAVRRDALEREAFGNHLILLPGDVVQLYVRDPSDNLVELDSPDAERLPAAMRSELVALADLHAQDAEQARGRLFVDFA